MGWAVDEIRRRMADGIVSDAAFRNVRRRDIRSAGPRQKNDRTVELLRSENKRLVVPKTDIAIDVFANIIVRVCRWEPA